MDSLIIGGKNYISSRRAAEILGYTQDYVGQLCRSGKMQGERVSGVWHVLETTLFGGEKKDNAILQKEIAGEQANNSKEKESQGVIVVEGVHYISSKRAAEILGYTQDYVGQLCRSGRMEARQIGRGWYIPEHIVSSERTSSEAQNAPTVEIATDSAPEELYYQSEPERTILPSTYLLDERPLIPTPKRLKQPILHQILQEGYMETHQPVPIHVTKIAPQTLSTLRTLESSSPSTSLSDNNSDSPFRTTFLQKIAYVGIFIALMASVGAFNMTPQRLVFTSGVHEEQLSKKLGAFSSIRLQEAAIVGTKYTEDILSVIAGMFESKIEYKASR